MESNEQGWQESLSTEETGSEDVVDNLSVASDVISQLSSRSLKRNNDTKKLLSTIQKLKQENMSLHEALASTNMLDLATLKNKLRGANADLIRLRQTNLELRERIQVLEKKIFDMVTSSREKESESKETSLDMKPVSLMSIKDKLKFLKRSQLGNQENSHQSDSGSTSTIAVKEEPKVESNSNLSATAFNTSNISLINPSPTGMIAYDDYLIIFNKARHYERLSQSLERRLDLMQEEDQRKTVSEPKGNQTKHRSIEFAETNNEEATEAVRKKKILKLSDEQQARDANTIRELAAEVKRLTSLLSRSKIEEDESFHSAAGDQSDHENSENVIADSKSMPATNLKPVVVVQGFSLLFVICIFLLGILCILIPLVILHPEVSFW